MTCMLCLYLTVLLWAYKADQRDIVKVSFFYTDRQTYRQTHAHTHTHTHTHTQHTHTHTHTNTPYKHTVHIYERTPTLIDIIR